MRKLIGLIVLVACSYSITVAAQIFGNLKEQGRSVGQGVEVTIDCGGKPQQASTDSYGAYSVYVPKQGKCAITVNYRNYRSDPYPIYSYEEPTRYDFDLICNSDGTLSLKRR